MIRPVATGLIHRLTRLALVALAVPGAAQAPVGGGDFLGAFPTTPPASHVLDDADLFRHDTATLQRISERLTALDARHKLPVYLAVYAGLIGTTPAQRAADLHRAWLGERFGFVLVFDSDTGDLGLGRPFAPDRADGPGAPGATAPGRIPAYELLEVMLRVNEHLKPSPERVEHLDRLTAVIAAEFDNCLDRLEAPLSRGDRLRFGLIIVGVIAALGLVGLIGMRLWSQAHAQTGRAWHFPTVLVGKRLGAPHGGGCVTARRFREPPAPPPADGAG